MDKLQERITQRENDVANAPAWRKAVRSVFGAAVRLHRYRGAQDTLLRKMLIDDERRAREEHCCYE